MIATPRGRGVGRGAFADDPDADIVMMLTGPGSRSYGEQEGERLKLGLMLNHPEEEHDRFSENTHNYDGQSIRNVYLRAYIRTEATVVAGPSLSEFVAESDPEINAALLDELNQAMVERGSDPGEALVVDALVAQTRSFERAVAALVLEQIGVEGSDSLDKTDAIFH